MERVGKIIVIVAPSGTGKSTLLARLQKDIPELKWSISCTTRSRRIGEVHGKDYFFISEEEFLERKNNNEFVEWAKVHSNYYGTLKSFIDEGVARGEKLLFDLDVQGCDSMKEIYGEQAKVIFIIPPSVEVLEERLKNRATDSDEVISERVNNAKRELQRKNDYDFTVINDKFETAYQDLKNVVSSIIGEENV
jgi:guanylate kinase